MLDAILQGILLGGYYALLAAGLSLMLGVIRFINLAHGDFAILGAYLVLFFVEWFGWPVGYAILVMIPLMGALGWGLQATIFARAMKGGFLLPLLVTIGLGAVLQNGMYGVFSSDAKSLGNYVGNLSWASWNLPFGLSVGQLPVWTFVVAVTVLGLLQFILSFTRFGRALRATATDIEAAELCGIDSTRVQRAAVAIAIMLAGIAGAALAMRSLINPYAGPAQLIFSFEAVVIGGIGSLWGTFIGGIVLGISQNLGALISPQLFQLAGHLVFFAVLAARFVNLRASRRLSWQTILRGA